MSFINFADGELEFKIVYYGCALGGKTTSLAYIHERVDAKDRGNLILLPTQSDRTLFFDFLPVEGGRVKGFRVRFKLWTVPGQVMYNTTRKLVLRGVDGLIFVIDSQWEQMEANIASIRNLRENLESLEISLGGLPWILFYNKRDLSEELIAPVESIDLLLDRARLGVPRLSGDCLSGANVFNALNTVTQNVLREFLRKDDVGNFEAYR